MYCVKCGTENKDSDKFCVNCGAPLGEQQSGSTNIPNNPMNENPFGQQNQGFYRQQGYMGNINSYLALSIISIFFCTPLGIAAIINSSKVKSLLASGDYEGAKKSSTTALWCGLIGLILGIIFVIIRIAVLVGETN